MKESLRLEKLKWAQENKESMDLLSKMGSQLKITFKEQELLEEEKRLKQMQDVIHKNLEEAKEIERE